MLLIEQLDRGAVAEVVAVEGDRHWVARLLELGIRPGQQICVLQPGSPCLLSLGTTRISIRLTRTGKVWVMPIADPVDELVGTAGTRACQQS